MFGWFSYFLIGQKNGLAILGLVILSPRLLSKLGVGKILLKCMLKVSASSSLIVIISLLSFNVIHCLWKVFSEKTGLIDFQKIFYN